MKAPDARIKIARVIARLNVGGPAIHVTLLNSRLDPARFESMLVTGRENPGEGSMLDFARSRGIEPIVIDEIVGEATFRPRDVTALAKVYRLFRRERPHIVHTHTAKAGFLGRVAGRLAGVPVAVHTYHGHVLHGYYGPARTEVLRRMEQALARISDRIIAVSEQTRRELVAYGVAPAEKIAVIPLGLDLDPFLRNEGERGQFRRELGVAGGAPLVGIVGRIFPIKNHRLFVDAAARVAAREPAARFVVVGDGILRSQMEQHAARLGIGDRVTFTGWRFDLVRIYADMDVLVVSSDNEGTPVSAIEAMASGVPVVATRVGGLPDMITEDETGYLVPPNDGAALADAVLRVLGDREAAARVGRAARAAAGGRFGVERLVADTARLYEVLVATNERTGLKG